MEWFVSLFEDICNTHPCQNGGTCDKHSINHCVCRNGYFGAQCEYSKYTYKYILV